MRGALPSIIRLFGITAVVCLAPTPALSQAYNATLSGAVTKIQEVLERASLPDCSTSRCLLAENTLRFTVRTPIAGSVSVELTRASIPTKIIREAATATESARLPILLKGTGRIRHYNSDGSAAQVPVAATLYRDSADPVLEVSLPHNFRFSRRSGVGVYRAHVSSLTNSSRRNSRADIPSSSAFMKDTCGLEMSAPRGSSLQAFRIEPIVRSQATYNVLYIGTDFDSAFMSRAGCSSTSVCNNKILSIMNQASVFYERQLGYSLEVTRQFGPTSFGRMTESGFLLDTIAESNRVNRGQFIHNGSNTVENQIDLFKSFTGRTMDGKVIGIAYVGTLCQNSQAAFSNAITQYVSPAVNPVVAAHEIGHTLNAQHVTAGIMKPNIGASPPQSFSSESLLTISDYLNRYYNECKQGTSSGMNNAPGDDPHLGKPVTMRLSARPTGARKLTLVTQVANVQSGCQVRIRAATSAKGASAGTVVTSILPTSSASTVNASVSFGTQPSSSGSRRVYLVAEYTCPVGGITEVSKVVSLDPNGIRGLRSKTTRTKWISLLRSGLS